MTDQVKMLQVVQNYKTGEIGLEEVDRPAAKTGGIVVRTLFSVISMGTEGTKVREAKMSLIEKARARPDQVRKVIESARQQGVTATYQKVINRLDSLTGLGYSLSGVVEAVGDDVREFEVGQAVACAGAGYANHAEFNFVPTNLVVPVPDGVAMEHAAFTTIGTIALHAMHQADVRLGETAAVIGLGIVGQVLCRLLRAAGVRVFGVDLDSERVNLALVDGADAAGVPTDVGWRNAMMRATGSMGADCVFLTVGAMDNRPLELASEVVRERGRLVAVGKTKLDLEYEKFFRKEIDVRFSRSYGPGRYDPDYEERGRDYPISYVRWTERRNLAAFIDLIASGRLDLSPLVTEIKPIRDAKKIYEGINAGTLKGVGIVFRFDTSGPPARVRADSTVREERLERTDRVRVGVIGAGNYASSMLLPHLKRDPAAELVTVATTSALSGANAQRKFGFGQTTTDTRDVICDPSIDMVVIATRNATHAELSAEALAAGKTVFVEKPLAIDATGLDLVFDAAERSGNRRLLVGFNRRHSPIVAALKSRLTGAPLTMLYRVHAGAIDHESWQNDPGEGSRFIGEAGHFLDLFRYLVGAPAVAVSGQAMRPQPSTPDDLENITVTVRYADGSIATLVYATQGAAATPKERLEVFGGGETLVIENYRTLEHFTAFGRKKRISRFGGDKGQRNQMKNLIAAASGSLPFPTSFSEIVEVTRATFSATDAALNSKRIRLDITED